MALGEEITDLLRAWRGGDENALHKLTPLVYDELRSLAGSYLLKERQEHTLQRTALVHEAFLRLAGNTRVDWQDRNHFFSLAATMMRRVLVDYARSRFAAKRGSDHRVHADLEITPSLEGSSLTNLLAVDQALDRLALIDARKARMVELHHFGGLGLEEIGTMLGVSAATVSRNLAAAETWLQTQLTS